MFRWKWKSVNIPHFAESRILYCQTPYLMKSLVSFVPVFFCLSQTCLSSLLEPCHMPTTHQGIPSPSSPYFLAFPSFLFEYRIVCTTLSLASYKQNRKWARQWGHMKSKQEIGNKKILLIPLPNTGLPSLASFSCQNLWCQMLCCLWVANYLYSHPSIWSSTFVDHSTQTWNEG